MKRAVGALVAGASVLIGLLSPAPAGAQGPRIPLPTPDPNLIVLAGYCSGFTVELTYTRMNEYIIHQTTAPDGTTTLMITGNARVTATNTATGKSISYNISGPGTAVFYPNGAVQSLDLHGPNLLWTLPEDLQDFPDVPPISYTTGHVTVLVDEDGQTVEYHLSGHRTDVCAALAAS